MTQTPSLLSLLSEMWSRVDREAGESDVAVFGSLLALFELELKITTAALLAAVETEREGHRYRLEHDLVRADGLGEWESALTEVVTGPANAFLMQAAWPDAESITTSWTALDDTWQRRAAQLLHDACRSLDSDLEPLPKRGNLLTWFRTGVQLRNRSRGHGALTSAQMSQLVRPIRESLFAVTENVPLFRRPWVVIRRTLAGKYHVVPLGGDTRVFSYLKSRRDVDLPNGVHVFFGGPVNVRLIAGDVDGRDFFLPNGNFRGTTYEGLSYVSGATARIPGDDYLAPTSPMPGSATEGLTELEVQGNAFGNVPPLPVGYVRRPELELELQERLIDSRHPVITLVGRGGIGKTSLALRVLHEVTASDAYEAVVWFSARDIELDPDRARTVRPQVKALDEVALEFDRLMRPGAKPSRAQERIQALANHLSGVAPAGPMLFVFDNFETVANPPELFDRLSNWVRLPNKVLITTRLRPFKGDYPVEVKGMTEPEMNELIQSHAQRLGVAGLSGSLKADIYHESEGHPYVAKILLGEIARRGGRPRVDRILANRDDILNALFERTYSSLPPAAQRAFLTLCNWRSAVPVIALHAVMLRPGNERVAVEDALDALIRSSMVDLQSGATAAEEFLSVPLYASLFGRQKLAVSPFEAAVEADTRLLQLFGAAKATEVNRGLAPRVDTLIRQVAERISVPEIADRLGELGQYLPVIEYVASQFPPTWMRLAELYEIADPVRGRQLAKAAVERYLQTQTDDADAWLRLANLSRRASDYLTEMHALLKRAEREGAPFADLTFAANRFNQLFGDGRLDLDSLEKRVMAERLRKAMESRVDEADSTDLSRLGWLCMHLRDVEAARQYAARGLELSPTNEYCSNLFERAS
jgi:tetratricopeptide (TPR) repeat protein